MPSSSIPLHWGSAAGDEFYTIKILKEDDFRGYDGFDIGGFDEGDSSFSAHTFYVPKFEIYGDFRRAIAGYSKVSSEQVRFWSCTRRINGTIRPSEPFVEHGTTDSTPMTALVTPYLHSALLPLKLYLEYTNDTRPLGIDSSFVFLKYFDVTGQSIRGIGSIHVSNSSKIASLYRKINRLMEWRPPKKLLLYEEVKPDRIDCLDWQKSFTESEIGDGDITCFQMALTTAETQVFRTWYPELILEAARFYAKLRSEPQGTTHHKLPKQAIDFVVFPGQSFEDALKCVQERLKVTNKDLTSYKFTCSNITESDAASTSFNSHMTCKLLVDPVSFMECMHVACGACAVEWFRRSSICHQCRQPVRAIHDIHAIAGMVEAYCQFNRLAARSDTELANLRTKYKPGQLIEINQPEEAGGDPAAEERWIVQSYVL
ncbi:putative ubiquitin carboxyl-terminal hydrolase 5 [Rhizoctonia solani]|uniref:Putative ubiquitin carboxyl-terminal hydrolase 5 n=1 Tax=Rhizoctonia solani TaxID=456999 RepID=A0A0K6G944_9AGAM|nr:putative ubiquitin carboxyl-terminal hydrolase 5 [Rhizoctonia solani]